MLIKKLEITGKHAATASIEFGRDCTIISGASDTGKTFIFECLLFMFGDSSKPKDIPQSADYDRVAVYIESNDRKIKLVRSIRGDDYEVEESDAVQKKTRDEVNNDFLSLIGLEKGRLRKNESNETVALSFSALRRFFFVNEVSVMEPGSPVLSEKNYSANTAEKSAFRVLLTGKDDSDLIAVDPPKIRIAKNKGKSEAVEMMVKKFSLNLSNQSKQEIIVELEKCDRRISHITEQIRTVGARSVELLRYKQNLYYEIDSTNARGLEITETIKRFSLLNVTYQKDVARLEFIGEANFLLNQLPPGDCPYCGKQMDHTHDNKSEIKTFDEGIMSALSAEGLKVRTLQKDLLSTLNDLHSEREGLIAHRREIEQQIKSAEEQMESEFGKVATNLKSELKEVMDERDHLMQLKVASDYIEQVEQIGHQLVVAPEKKEKVVDRFGEDGSLFGLEEEIQLVLNAWFDRTDIKVKFEKEDYDIVIDGRARKGFGKGFRSIYRTAFHIGLANYCIKKKLPHTGFVVVDSPLTTHGEADDKIDEGIESTIFDYFMSYKMAQLIVIDNKEPKTTVPKNIRHIHFSGVAGSNNQGFLPSSKMI